MWILILVAMTLLGSLGAICLKFATAKMTGVFSLLKNKWFYSGGLLYVGGALLNIYLLTIMEYSVVLPLTAITYVWTVIFSRLFFKEKINLYKIAAILFILTGVALIAAK